MGPEKHELSAVEFRKPAVAIDHGVGFEGDASLVDAEKVAEQKKTLFVGTDNDGPEPSKIVQVAD